MVRRVKGWLALVVAVIFHFEVGTEKAHPPAQSPPEPQLQRREEDLVIQTLDERADAIPPEFTPPPANPIIGFRYGRDALQWPQAFVAPRFLPFPYWEQAPANPILPFRYGRWLGDAVQSLNGVPQEVGGEAGTA